jgi:hypothetical protein
MRLRLPVVVCLALVLLVQCACLAQSAKYTQDPKMEGGFSFASMIQTNWTAITADDWVCADGLEITGIRWWGSYWTPPSPGNYVPYSSWQSNASPGVVRFKIDIYENEAAGGTMPFDHPGPTKLAEWVFSVGNFSETKVQTVADPVVTDIYEYYVTFTKADPGQISPAGFQQEQGKKYWLAIAADDDMPTADTNRQWGWREAIGRHGSYAVQGIPLATSDPMPWYIPCGGHDMAFELSVVPEPGSLAALAAGLVGLTGIIIRRRNR